MALAAWRWRQRSRAGVKPPSAVKPGLAAAVAARLAKAPWRSSSRKLASQWPSGGACVAVAAAQHAASLH